MGYIFDAILKNKADAPQPAPRKPAPFEMMPDALGDTAQTPPNQPPAAWTMPSPPTAPQAPASPADAFALNEPYTQDAPRSTQTPQSTTAQNPPPPIRLAQDVDTGPDINRVDDRLVMLTDPASTVAEEYRSIRTSLLARHETSDHRVHLITSATPQEGKTITTVNLGLSFAELGNKRTLIVEADLRLPNFDRLLDLKPKAGLLQVLRGEAKLEDVIHQLGTDGLYVLPAGGRTTNEAVKLLSSQNCTMLIHRLRASFDHVLIDTPPVNELADAGILASLSDEVMLVARLRRTPRELVQQAIRTLQSYNAPLVGTIATDNRRRSGRYGKYGYKYGYRYQYTRSRKRAA